MFQYQCSKIADELYQGPIPPSGPALAENGFNLLVLCAAEYQPAPNVFPGIKVINAPGDDAEILPIPKYWFEKWSAAADEVVLVLQNKERILVTCKQGLNRSGIVTAMAWHRFTGLSGKACVELVRAKREGSLFNRAFVSYLDGLQGIV